MRPFFNVKFVNNIVKYILPLFYIIQPFFLQPMCTILQGNLDAKLILYLYSLENAIALGVSLFYLVKSIIEKEVPSKKDVVSMIFAFLALNIFTLPNYFPQYMFGMVLATNTWIPKDFTQTHRILIYFNLILPFVIYYFLQGKEREFKKFNLLYICLAVLLGFIVKYCYDTFTQPWLWPFHLCNTALFILPLVLIFKMDKIFYFTYFINVIGALLAMLLPNYASDLNIMSIRVVGFWYNHYIVFVF